MRSPGRAAASIVEEISQHLICAARVGFRVSDHRIHGTAAVRQCGNEVIWDAKTQGLGWLMALSVSMALMACSDATRTKDRRFMV